MSPSNIGIRYYILIVLLVYISTTQSQLFESTRIDFGSCNHQNIPNAITWASIVDRNPDLFIWTGDVVYLDHDLQQSKYPYSDYSVILYVFNAFLLGNPINKSQIINPKNISKGEPFEKNDIWGILLVIAGSILAVVFGPKSQGPDPTVVELQSLAGEAAFLIFFFIFTGIALLDFVMVKYYERKNFTDKSNKEVTHGAKFLMVSYVALAAYFGSVNVLFMKAIVLILAGFEVDYFKGWLLYFVIVGIVVVNVLLEFFRQRALAYFGALFVVSIYQVLLIVGSAMMGAVFFNEFAGLAAYELVLFILAIIITMMGVATIDLWPAKYDLMNNIKYQELKNLTKIIGICDDHDIGENNADYTWEHKDETQKLFLDFLETPADDPLRNQSGVYQYYEMQKQFNINEMTFIKSIDIIMFDTRYFSKRDGEDDILGAEQWQWFENTIANELHGELLLIISCVQIMNDLPLNSREGWYKYPYSQQKLFRLLDEYNTCDRLLLISGDVHLSELMHGQCNSKSKNNSETDYYEITSSGFTHAMMFESPYLEKFSYRLDDYAQEDGVIGCNWLGLNFGELNIDWYFNDTQNDVKIKNVSVEIRDEKGDIKCIQDLPLFGYSDHHEYTSKSNYLWDNDYQICYGVETFHSRHGVKSVIAICGMSWFIMVLYPQANKKEVEMTTIDKNEPAQTKQKSIFGGLGVLTRKKRGESKHVAEPSLMNPSSLYGNDDADKLKGHHNAYYKTYGYIMMKNFKCYSFIYCFMST